MANGFSVLDRQIARLRELGTGFVRDAAPEVAEACRDEIEGQIAAGVGPDGQPWAAKKEGTGKPLANAAQALAVVPVGTTIFFRLRGPEARHHRGIAKGGVVRRIIPVASLPGPIAKAIGHVLSKRFNAQMGGAT